MLGTAAATLPPDAFDSLFPPSLRLIGEDYLGLGRLSYLMVAGSRIAGAVAGHRHDYWVVLSPNSVRCSHCSRPCRHGAALAAAWRSGNGAFIDVAALVDRLMASQDPAPLVAGLLEDQVLDALLAFTDLPFIPPCDPDQDLLRLPALAPADQVAALARLVRLFPARPALLARALKEVPGLPLTDLIDLTLAAHQQQEEPADPFATLLASRLDETDLPVFLGRLLALYYDRTSRGLEVGSLLLRAGRILALRPHGDLALAYLAGLPEAPLATALMAADLAVLAGRPRQALSVLDQALIGAGDRERLALTVRQAEIAQASGSAREAPLWLAALAEGSPQALDQLVRRFPRALRATDGELATRLAERDPDLACRFALAVKDVPRAAQLAQTRALALTTLRRLVPVAKRQGYDPASFSTSHLSPRQRQQFRSLLSRPLTPRTRARKKVEP